MAQASSSLLAGPSCRLDNLRALIIEDEAIIAADIELTLHDRGYMTVGPARTHNEALALGVEAKPSIIIADIVLSDGTSGFTAVDEILKSTDACVIFVTGDPDLAKVVEKAGPCLIVSKPFCPETLEAAITNAEKCSQTRQSMQETKWAVHKLAHDQPDAPFSH
ncbi:MAG: response regulator [Methylocystis sp.]|uniref:response regulator n=1 Tax=Methylocystis sp. TaxID=1911079 RepID=UPI003DA42ABC